MYVITNKMVSGVDVLEFCVHGLILDYLDATCVISEYHGSLITETKAAEEIFMKKHFITNRPYGWQ